MYEMSRVSSSKSKVTQPASARVGESKPSQFCSIRPTNPGFALMQATSVKNECVMVFFIDNCEMTEQSKLDDDLAKILTAF